MKKYKFFLSFLFLCLAWLFAVKDNSVFSKEKPSLDEVYEAYKNVLANPDNRATSFNLKDLNKDGIPELLFNNAYQICSYDEQEGIKWLWDSWVICDMYYSEQTNRILYHYSYQGDEDWVIYEIDMNSGELVWVDCFGIINGMYYHGFNESGYNEVTKEDYDAAIEKIDELLPDKDLLTTPYENTQENRDKLMPTLRINKEKLTVYAGGKKARLSVAGTENGVKWSSSDSSIAKVTEKGYVYGLKPGKCKITAAVDGRTLECTVTVKKISLNKTSLTLKANETYQLKLYGINDGIKWTSSDKSIVKVSKNGTITALKKGTATVKATVNKTTYTCKVKVK
mgnify:CR=1 FL=1